MVPKDRLVLHVDDDPLVTTTVADFLAEHGMVVESLNDPAQAMDRIRHGNYRVVILDVYMPGVNGLDLLRQIKDYDGSIGVIMFTGLVNMSTVLKSLRWGAEACVFKPLKDDGALLSAVEDAFHKLDRWWRTLEELAQQRRRGQSTLSTQPIAATQELTPTTEAT